MMFSLHYVCSYLLLSSVVWCSDAFQLLPSSPPSQRFSSSALSVATDPQEKLKLSVESFQAEHPSAKILECDAAQVQTMNAALWSTLATMSQSDDAQHVCMTFPQIPLSALTSFISDYAMLRLDDRLMAQLPELERIQISLLQQHDTVVQPALVIQTQSRTSQQSTPPQLLLMDEQKCTAALKEFVNGTVVGLGACPYTKTPDWSATGLEKRGVTPGPVAYNFCADADACAAVAAFWESVSELLATPETEISTTLLSLPAIGAGLTPQDHDRFAAVVELISRNLCLFRGDGAVGLVHFHPAYTRTKIHPANLPAFGHLPPQSWLPAMLQHNNGQDDIAQSMSENDWFLSNYQRRAPHTMINILRVTQLNAAVGAKSIVDLPLADGTTQKASGITLYSKNAIRLAEQGKDALDAAMEAIWEKYQ
ncbi:expressed unknown protein [Seminavis robusta]|uniref:Uncharacterized protein n=1 Tax=Seminavis robusta TaxID=568900 RepID=A0A9N8H9G9_9STRA|nr:expressed unknown protein [Seminavis robusta]|eukprot:Sro205_g086360.1 n/a (423) ;mRNA; f:80916-82184